MEPRPPWSDRRRRTLLCLGLGVVAFGLGAVALPDQYGRTSAFLAALCGFLLVVAAIVFLVIPPAAVHGRRTALAVDADIGRGRRLDRRRGPGDPALGLLSSADRLGRMELPTALYVPADDGFVASALTIGPWDPGLQHAGPPAALLLREAEAASGVAGGQTVRMAFDIFAPVPVGPIRVRTTVVRPGRRIELVETVLSGDDHRPLMRLSAWRMRIRDDGPLTADLPHPAAAAPEESRPEDAAFFPVEIAYHRALEWRFPTGSFNSPGPASAWTRTRCELVAGEPMTPLQHLLVMTDAASGISAELDWNRATFANVDLLVSLHRQPRGDWLGMDARTVLGGTGAAQCGAVLFDADGAIGRSAQSLFVEPR